MILRLDPIALLLSVALVLSPLARHGLAGGDGDQAYGLVICSEYGAEVIAADPDGNPHSTAHFCLECCLVTNVLLAEFRSPQPQRLAVAKLRWLEVGLPDRPNARLRPWGRGPPVTV